jgi:hypothetical protein
MPEVKTIEYSETVVRILERSARELSRIGCAEVALATFDRALREGERLRGRNGLCAGLRKNPRGNVS